jgi:hypothetical protein
MVIGLNVPVPKYTVGPILILHIITHILFSKDMICLDLKSKKLVAK